MVEARRPAVKPWVLVLFFPITIYFFLGTFLLFLLAKVHLASERLIRYATFVGSDFKATEFHRVSVWLTIAFPIVFPLLLAWVLLVLGFAIIAAIFQLVLDVLRAIWQWAVRLVTAIWRWTINALDGIWRAVRGVFE